MGKFVFQKATKKKAKLRLALIGGPGSGKTMTALKVARGLGTKIALIDTERESASKYAGDVADFETVSLDSFEPATYIAAMDAAAEAGFDVLVIDSLSHAWSGEGGLLDQKDKKGGNSFDAWRTLTPQHNKLIDALLSWPGHLIATMRVKTEYVVEKSDSGKTTVRKVGLAPVQRDGMEYEFDVVGDINSEHVLTITKSRCPALADKVIRTPGADVAKALLSWLDEGVEAPKPAAESAPAASPYKGRPVADVTDAADLRGYCAYYAKGLRKGLAEDNPDAIAALERIVARGEALGVAENVIKHWLGIELGKAA